jgi:hypothetical protein
MRRGEAKRKSISRNRGSEKWRQRVCVVECGFKYGALGMEAGVSLAAKFLEIKVTA